MENIESFPCGWGVHPFATERITYIAGAKKRVGYGEKRQSYRTVSEQECLMWERKLIVAF